MITSFLQTLRQLFMLFRWWVIIMPWEQAVRVTLGKNARVLLAGVHLKIPFVHAVYRQSIRLRAMGIPTQTVSTKDGKTITLSASVGFSISNILRLYQTLHNAEQTVVQLVEIAIADFVTQNDLTDCRPRQICESAIKAVDLTRFGLGEVRLSINSFAMVKTFRIINDQRYAFGGDLNMMNEESGSQGSGPIPR